MTFEEALEAMKRHKVVRRKAWANSKSITIRAVKKEIGKGCAFLVLDSLDVTSIQNTD